jgi:hypothetical protein
LRRLYAVETVARRCGNCRIELDVAIETVSLEAVVDVAVEADVGL